MHAPDVISSLGGNAEVAAMLGAGRKAVGMWKQPARGIPAEFWIPLWCLALERGVAWTPPGGERLAALLRASPAPAPAESYPPLAEAA